MAANKNSNKSRTLIGVLVAGVIGGFIGILVLGALIYLSPGVAQSNTGNSGNITETASPEETPEVETSPTPVTLPPISASPEPSATIQLTPVGNIRTEQPTISNPTEPKRTPAVERTPIVKQTPNPRPQPTRSAPTTQTPKPNAVPTVHP